MKAQQPDKLANDVGDRMEHRENVRRYAQSMYTEAMNALATDSDFLVARIEETIRTAAPRIMRRHLLRKMRPHDYEQERTNGRRAR